MKPRLKRKLGMFRNLVLDLLNRDPAKRPSMQRFCAACHHLMSSTVTVKVRAPQAGANSGAADSDLFDDDAYDEIIQEREVVSDFPS